VSRLGEILTQEWEFSSTLVLHRIAFFTFTKQSSYTTAEITTSLIVYKDSRNQGANSQT